MKKTFEIPKIRIAHISKFLGGFLGVFDGQKYKIMRAHLCCCQYQDTLFLPLGLKAQRGIAMIVAGGRAACAIFVPTHFFVQFFSYDPEISHECSPP